jgi:EAL domain-containing protein (putative c-di-GMP-specific phosphodiesterase class I)
MSSEAGQQFSFDGEMLKAGLCIGLATSTQLSEQMAVSPELLSRVTDFALYASKSRGRNEFTVYNRDLEKQFLERRAMINELPQAIDNGELVVHLQPKVDLSEGTVYGLEALVRWNRNGHITPPANFVLIAEESGSIVDIDRFVLNKETDYLAVWNKDHDSDYSVSVNLSALHFSSRRIIDWTRDALHRSGLPPHLLTLEITETLELRNWDLARTIIDELHALGCKIAIDDFGAGVSSLAYLRTTKADELKIDRSLVEEIEHSEDARLLLSSVFDIAHNLNLIVTVEGIETEAQSIILQDMGAPHGQGYLFGKPRPPDEALNAASVFSGRITQSGAA